MLLGRDRDASGKPIPGARVQKTYNLMDMGIAWHDDIASSSEAVELIKQVRRDFATL